MQVQGDFAAKLKAFERFDEQVQFCMWKELRNHYAQRARPEVADALAVQVTKYLMGHDLDAVRQSASPDGRRELDACRPDVEGEADRLMHSDQLVNELVRRTLMTKFVLYSCRYGSRWLDSPDGTNTEAQIRRHGDAGECEGSNWVAKSRPREPDVHGHDDMDEYARCASQYVARTEAAERARPK
jgi:hypothetical protein